MLSMLLDKFLGVYALMFIYGRQPNRSLEEDMRRQQYLVERDVYCAEFDHKTAAISQTEDCPGFVIFGVVYNEGNSNWGSSQCEGKGLGDILGSGGICFVLCGSLKRITK